MTQPTIIDASHMLYQDQMWTLAKPGPVAWFMAHKKMILGFIGAALSSGGSVTGIVVAVRAAHGDLLSPGIVAALSAAVTGALAYFAAHSSVPDVVAPAPIATSNNPGYVLGPTQQGPQ